jgi:hypothetical protein
MKLGQNWRELGKVFSQVRRGDRGVLVAGAVYFVWTHWQNRIGRRAAAAK